MKIDEVIKAIAPTSVADAAAEALKRQTEELRKRKAQLRVAKARERLNKAQQQVSPTPITAPTVGLQKQPATNTAANMQARTRPL